MNKPVIAVDLDDVLGDENGAMIQFINQTYGSSHTSDDYLNADAPYGAFWEVVWKVNPEEAETRYRAFLKSPHKHNQRPLPDALAVLKQLKTKYTLEIITARPQSWAEKTHTWLNEHYPEVFKNVHFVPMWADGQSTKAEIANKLGAQYLIDDNFEHCSLAAEAGTKALLFGEYGWNKVKKLPKNMTRVRNWAEVRDYFNGAR